MQQTISFLKERSIQEGCPMIPRSTPQDRELLPDKLQPISSFYNHVST